VEAWPGSKCFASFTFPGKCKKLQFGETEHAPQMKSSAQWPMQVQVSLLIVNIVLDTWILAFILDAPP
jgi:hypothetical protein